MILFNNSTLRQLWDLAGGNPDDPSCDWNDTFDPVGLILLAPPRNEGYWCTPTNSLTFATTGGGGTHYGLLATNGELTDLSPVVMTVPMSDTPNTIVGANLKEFLALGCRYGYFALEQLVYDEDATLKELELARFDPEYEQHERDLLQRISSTFNLKPWQSPTEHLQQLQIRFAPEVQLLPEVKDAP